MPEIVGDPIYPSELIVPTALFGNLSGGLFISGGTLIFLHGDESIEISGAAIANP